MTRRRSPLRATVVATTLLSALALAACTTSPPNLSGLSVRPDDSLQVTIVDETGRVAEMSIIDPVRPPFDAARVVTNLDGRDDVLVVRWIGGRCASPPVDARITLTPRADRVSLTVMEKWTLQGCTNAVGVMREVDLRLDRPLRADQVDAEHIMDPAGQD
jgi:hypothetical protein